MNGRSLATLTAGFAGAIVALLSMMAAAAEPGQPGAGRPLEVLYITGGCCHDYEGQKAVITAGLASRARIRTTVVHEGGTANDHRVSIYSKPGWSKGCDVVFHNECFSDVKDPAFLAGIIAEHETGVPAVLMHCAMHSYRVGNDDWFRFCGITSPGHGAKYAYTARLVADHPTLRGLPANWEIPHEELYFSAKVWPTATPLAEAMSREKNAMQTVIWTNQAGKARVFGTTIGHFTETVKMPAFLDLLTRGTLWAAGKLQADGTPVPELQLGAGAASASP